jgi:branched-chain amino acid transport system substrate-binding protein
LINIKYGSGKVSTIPTWILVIPYLSVLRPLLEDAMIAHRLALIAAAALLSSSSVLAADDVLTIGFTVSRTGKLNNDSTAQMRGFESWRDEVNDKGGISVGGKQYKINFVSYDDESVNARVQQLYTRLINQDKAHFLFSPYSSGLVATAAIVSEQYGRIMLTTGAAEEKTYKLGNKNLFQVYSSADRYLAGAIDAVKELNPNAQVALVYKDDPFSKAVLQSARKQVGGAGLRTVLDEAYSPETTDFGPVINKIISAKADILLGGGHYPDGATLARQIYDHKAGLKWVTLLVAPDSPNFATLGEAAIGVTVPSQWEPQVSFKPDFGPTAADFTQRFHVKYGIEPGYHAAGGYTAGLILQSAIEQAGSPEQAKVAAVLNRMDATTMFGRTKFSTDPKEHGLQIGHEMIIAQWQKKSGALFKEVIWPKAARTSDIVY